MRVITWFVALVLGLLLIVRGIIELFTIDYSSPATYRDDWGGPSDEDDYVPPLEAVGYVLWIREPRWFEHLPTASCTSA
jgi:hypothetical protein